MNPPEFAQGGTPKYAGRNSIILAQVTNINDPDNLNRVRCKPVSADQDVAETDWCYCLSPMAGKSYGQFYFPVVGDYVVLGYLGGDVHHPIILGCYWANDNTPPYKVESGENMVRSIKTPAGVEIKLDDTKEKEKLTLSTPSGALIVLDDEKKNITVQGKEADNKLSIDWEKGEITLAAKTKLTLSVGKASITLESSGDIKCSTQTAVNISATNVDIKASGAMKAKGAQMELAADGLLKAQSSGAAILKGQIVQIN